eukprot:368705-Prymnesium_polylepis.2
MPYLGGATEERATGLREARQLGLLLLELSDVLPHAHHAHNRVVGAAPRRRVEQNVDRLALLCVQRELEVGRLLGQQRLVQHVLNLVLEVGRDELAHQVLPHHLLAAVSSDLGGLA